ncbi:hypothetical protein ERX46_05555 [Brumimicrobium glaciale]|uniref:Uncharacterized protein n=1 Tax=Brumimicrobium glaciale TaxID=200475 RepID=A0A4Q4KN49_9FLAO|nr:hypothetical protein [Brumimicrobium glaciale]RYM34841.1 hypothetical protein ERX46_05555 [Brumimicrobium glaciale]
MKRITTILALCLFSIMGQTQILDVFQNKEYSVSSYVLSAEIKKDYSPSKLEIVHDKNKDKNEVWSKIEDQFFSKATATVNDEVSFFQLNSKALKQQSQIEKWNRLQGNDTRFSTNPKFKSIDIELVSVLNNCGIYSINYNFEMNSGGHYGKDEIPIKQFYLADFEKNTIIEINDSPSAKQQDELRKLTLSKFKTLYLLKTQKIDLDNLERIEHAKENKAIGLEIESKIYFSEALVYPYLTGVIVEFPERSNSSELFNNESFRVFLKDEEVQELLKVYPEFKPAFKNDLTPSSKTQIEQLNNDNNFDLSRFQHAPKELQMLDILDFEQKVYTMKITSYQLNDTNRRFMGTKKIFFNKSQQVNLIEYNDEYGKIRSEEIYKYNAKNQLENIGTSDRDKSLKLYHYKNDILDYTENYELDVESSYQGTNVDLEIEQEHIIYSNNYQYTLRLNLVGEFNTRAYTQLRYLEKNQFCTNSYCVLTDENQNIIGVKQKRSGLFDILTNDKNQPVESYIDNDRHQHFFTYDEQGRIIELNSKSDSRNSFLVTYKYHMDKTKALVIKEVRGSYSNETVIEHVYEFGFWEE